MGMCVVIRLVAWGGDVLSEGGWDGTGDIRLPGGPGILMARHGTTNDRPTARLPRDSEPPRGCGQPHGHPEGGGFRGLAEGMTCGDIMKVMMLCHQDDPSADQPDVFGGGC